MQAKDSEVVAVVFRVWPDGDVLALFPELDYGQGTCCSFMHVGQHGGADYVGCIARTRPAKPHEYANLKRELESVRYEYKLRVCRRRPPHRRRS